MKRIYCSQADKKIAGALARSDGEKEEFPGFVIPADKNPNRAGVIQILGDKAFDEAATIQNLEGVENLLILNAIPFYKPTNKKIYFKKSDLDNWIMRNRRLSKDEVVDRAQSFIDSTKSDTK